MRNYVKKIEIYNIYKMITKEEFIEFCNDKQFNYKLDDPANYNEYIWDQLMTEYYVQHWSDISQEKRKGRWWLNPVEPFERNVIHKMINKWRQGQHAIWITLAPDYNTRRIPYTEENIEKLRHWCRQWFSEKRYSYYRYIIEEGSKEFLHVHCLVQLKHAKSAKNHARDLRKYWNKTFPSSPLVGKDYLSQNVTGIYLQDKLNYMQQGNKGSHANAKEIHDGFGAHGVLE